MEEDNIVILGAGVTGLTVAERLSRVYGNKVIVIEKEPIAGGLASTLSANGFSFDLGSHRLHPTLSSDVLRYIENVTGRDLLIRHRNGKLYIGGRFIDYPSDIFDLFKVYSSSDIIKSALRYFSNLIFPEKLGKVNFEAAMIRAVGFNIYHKVYRDYAKKLWGIEPSGMSVEAMYRRKTVFGFKIFLNTFKRRHYYLYPRSGIGEIINKLEACVLSNKASILKGIEPTKASVSGQRIKLFFGSRQDIKNPIEASLVVSTIPLDELYYLFCADCNDGPRLKWRGVRLLYIVIKEQIKHPTETFYFPSTDIILGRVSEIKKYSPFINQGIKETLLTIEIPVSSGDRIWEMPEEPLLKLCVSDLVKTGVFEKIPTVVKSFSLKLDKVYPLYILGWESDFFAIYNRLNSIHNLFSVGRGGLFLHCNIDHCITQGLELSDLILSNKSRNKDLWEKKVLRFLKFSARD